MTQEITWVHYVSRVSVQELEGKTTTIQLYKGRKPVSFKKITFKKDGRVEKIAFRNHEELDSGKYEIPLLGQDWSLTCPTVTGIFHEGGEAKQVTITVEKIRKIEFPDAPSSKK
jgi:hypothetical protein